MNSYLPVLEKAVDEVRSGRPAALCAVVATRGSTPQSPGAMLLVDASMNTVGTLGGGCVEAEICKRAFTLLRSGESQLLSFQLDHDYGWDDGLICGGGMDVAVMALTAENAEQVERGVAAMRANKPVQLVFEVTRDGQPLAYRVGVESTPRLLIAGAGHIGARLARLCVDLDFSVTVIDDRADFANPDRLPPPINIVVGDIEKRLGESDVDRDTYVVIVTRGHNHDEQALSAVVRSDARYIGLIGSRRKIKLIFDDLVASGVDRPLLDRVHAPIGLDINAVTVAEIAVSIAGQLVAVRRADKHKLVEGPLAVGGP